MPIQSSNYLDILNAAAAVVTGLGLTDWNGNVLPVHVRKIVINRQNVDARVPAIYVAPGHHIPGGGGQKGGGRGGIKQEGVEETIFGPNIFVWYPVAINLIIASNQDVNTHLDYLLSWRQILRRTFQKPTLAGVPSVFNTVMHPLINKAAENTLANWDAELISVDFCVTEPRDYP